MGPCMTSILTSLQSACYPPSGTGIRSCSRYLRYTTSPFATTLVPPTKGGKWITDAGDHQWTSFRSGEAIEGRSKRTALESKDRWLDVEEATANPTNRLIRITKKPFPWSLLLTRIPALPLLSTFALSSVFIGWLLKANLSTRYPSFTRANVNLFFGLSFALYVHGLGLLFPLFFTSLFYLTSRALRGTNIHTPTVWALAAFAIVSKEPNFPFKRYFSYGGIMGVDYNFLDGGVWGGEYGWHLSMNLVLLRLLSFAVDWHYATLEEAGEGKVKDEGKIVDKPNVKRGMFEPMPSEYYKSLSSTSHPLHTYTYLNLLSHTFYAPLFLAGPTITFNAYMSHVLDDSRVTRIPLKQKVAYTLLTIAGIAYLDAGLSLVHPFALYRSGLLTSSTPPLQSAGVIWFTLCFMWLKFTTLWRFARCWGIWDGVDAPENMHRVWNDNWNISGFWKGWHSSFNLWLVRYIYVPLGGRGNKNVAVWFVFSFVAIWHDAEMKLFMWGGLNAAFFVIENLGRGAWRSVTPH